MDKPAIINGELQSLQVHKKAYETSIERLEDLLPQRPDLKKTIAQEKASLTEVTKRIEELSPDADQTKLPLT